MADRKAKEERTGKKTSGRNPKPKDSDQVNFTDYESGIMLTSWQQAYNLQSCVDMDSYMILGGSIPESLKLLLKITSNFFQIF